MRTTEAYIANERVASTVKLVRLIIATQTIFLCLGTAGGGNRGVRRQSAMTRIAYFGKGEEEEGRLGRFSAHLGPVDLKIGKVTVVPLGQEGKLMGVLVAISQVLAVLLQRARFIPPLGDTGVVLPLVKKL